MGLDISLYHVIKPNTIKEKIIKRDVLYDNHPSILVFQEQEDKPLSKTIKRIGKKTTILYRAVDASKVKLFFPLAFDSENDDDYFFDINVVSLKRNGKKYRIVNKAGEKTEITESDFCNLSYYKKEESPHYLVYFEVIAYQRGLLKDTGYDELPGNCELVDDKKLIKHLVNDGLISEDFIDKWIDGETIFQAWW